MDKNTYLKIRNELNFRPSELWMVIHLLQDLFLTAAIIGLVREKTLPFYVVAQLLLACLYFRAFSMMHEAVHGSITKNTYLNNCLGVLYGGLCFLPYTTWRTAHLDHHAWAGNVEKDPVMRMVREFPLKSETYKRVNTYIWRYWIPYIAFLQEVLFWTISARFIVENNKYMGKRLELLASVAAPTLFFAGLMLAGFGLGTPLFFFPSFLAYLVMVEVVNFPHHLRLPRLVGEARLNLWDQHKISRTCVYSGWFARFVLLNFNYHTEHHMFPTLPWRELSHAHEKVMSARPEEYQMCMGHQWIRENRRQDLNIVFAPTAILETKEAKPNAA